MNATSLFDMIILACSEDKALLESNLSAVAGGRPMGRSFLGCGLTFFKYRDTLKAINSCNSNTIRSEKTSDIDINPQLNYLSHFWGSVHSKRLSHSSLMKYFSSENLRSKQSEKNRI